MSWGAISVLYLWTETPLVTEFWATPKWHTFSLKFKHFIWPDFLEFWHIFWSLCTKFAKFFENFSFELIVSEFWPGVYILQWLFLLPWLHLALIYPHSVHCFDTSALTFSQTQTILIPYPPPGGGFIEKMHPWFWHYSWSICQILPNCGSLFRPVHAHPHFYLLLINFIILPKC